MNLPEHPAWSIIDSSKMDDYDRCPRYFFYRHVLGWQLDIPAHDLVFNADGSLLAGAGLVHFSNLEPRRSNTAIVSVTHQNF